MKLKNCPFCGTKADIVLKNAGGQRSECVKLEVWCHGDDCMITMQSEEMDTNCRSINLMKTYKDLIKSWNKRV